MTTSQWRIRPKALIKPMLIGIPTIVVLTGVFAFAYHPVRVSLAGGEWCTRFAPNGEQTILYGNDCRQ
jgi:hypothetical protein